MVGLNTVSGEKKGVNLDHDYTLDGMTFSGVGAYDVMDLRVITGQASINIPIPTREEPCLLRGPCPMYYVFCKEDSTTLGK